jgi:hypothetical protein
MQILASSITRASEVFLHAGYISANPRTFGGYMYSADSDVHYEVAESLRLEGETLASHIPAYDPGSLLAAVAGSGDWLTMALGTAGFFGGLAGVYLIGKRLGGAPRLVGQMAAALVAALCLVAATCSTTGDPPLPEDPPWEGVEIKPYAHPEDATFVILHGIVADGITNLGRHITSLANIQDEVGLPASSLTEGQAYALQTYGLDGWGREMRLERIDNYYIVTSAGADGAFDTDDDISLRANPTCNENWDEQRRAFFLREQEGSIHIFFHRWTGAHFVYNDEDGSLALTGTDLFDYITEEDLYGEQIDLMQGAWDATTDGLAYEPMVMQIAESPY